MPSSQVVAHGLLPVCTHAFWGISTNASGDE
jgi:hypothetical protein